MTKRAYKDNVDGYYEADVVDGQPDPEWVTSKGLTPTDVVVPVVAPFDQWKVDIAKTDSSMPRSLEDLITDKFAGDAGTALQERYDKKIKIRGERP